MRGSAAQRRPERDVSSGNHGNLVFYSRLMEMLQASYETSLIKTEGLSEDKIKPWAEVVGGMNENMGWDENRMNEWGRGIIMHVLCYCS